MKYILIILTSFVSLTGFSQTQLEMNYDANESYKKVDKELNSIYKTILGDYKSDTAFIKNLKASQRIWITYRDAELKVKFPETENGYYGSIYPMCVSMYLENITQARVNILSGWIDGIEEGDACSGSMKIKEE